MPDENDWRNDVYAVISRERMENRLDRDGCKEGGAIYAQITDRIDALTWALRILPVSETLRKFVHTIECERDANFERHNRIKKRVYSTTAYALDWVAARVRKVWVTDCQGVTS